VEPLIDFKIEPTSGTQRAIRRLLSRGARGAFLDYREEMDEVGKWLLTDARRRLEARGSDVSTGRLAKSLTHHPYKTAVTVSSVLPYARIQQEGGTVKPKKRKRLAIPLRLDLARSHTWPKHWKAGRLACVVIDGKLFLKDTKTDELVYLLVKKVKIKGRPYLVRSRALNLLLEKLMAAKMAKFLRGIFHGFV